MLTDEMGVGGQLCHLFALELEQVNALLRSLSFPKITKKKKMEILEASEGAAMEMHMTKQVVYLVL